MQVIESPVEMQSWAIRMRGRGKLLALVPTMGALHEGHLSLVDIAKKRADLTVASIFVNPAQFGPNEDFTNYPRGLEDDLKALEARGVDIAFTPKREMIYPEGYSTTIKEEFVSKHLCGVSRPLFFGGVTTVVAMLFNICRPDVAVFGRKDVQQTAVLRKMVKDLWMPLELIEGPTVREESGLAMSSRNRYLEPSRLAEAAKLYQALTCGKELVDRGVTNVDRVKAEVAHWLSQSRMIRVIYIEVVDRELMQPVREIVPGKCVLAAAIWLEETRLIDNVEL